MDLFSFYSETLFAKEKFRIASLFPSTHLRTRMLLSVSSFDGGIISVIMASIFLRASDFLVLGKGKDLGNINCHDSNVKNSKIGNDI
jgi:hypothetical protein